MCTSRPHRSMTGPTVHTPTNLSVIVPVAPILLRLNHVPLSPFGRPVAAPARNGPEPP